MSQSYRLILVVFGTLLGVLIINIGIIKMFRKKPGQVARQSKVINRALKSIKNPLADDTEELKNIEELSKLVRSMDQSKAKENNNQT